MNPPEMKNFHEPFAAGHPIFGFGHRESAYSHRGEKGRNHPLLALSEFSRAPEQLSGMGYAQFELKVEAGPEKLEEAEKFKRPFCAAIVVPAENSPAKVSNEKRNFLSKLFMSLLIGANKRA